MTPVTFGFDNGQSASLGAIDGAIAHFRPVPTKSHLHYGKRGSISQRLDRAELRAWILGVLAGRPTSAAQVFVERPFTGGPRMVNAALSAARFFEATIITLEDLDLGYEVVDSGTWQKPVLGDVRGSKDLKLASKLRGIQMYPQFKDAIAKHGDADGLLIARHFSRE
jgi:hypothetical protein